MKKTLLIIPILISGCMYAPTDDHSTHYNTKNVTHQTKPSSDEDFVQYSQTNSGTLSNTTPSNAPFYEGGFTSKPIPRPVPRPVVVASGYYYTPYYLPPQPRANRSMYYVESNF